MTTTGSKHRHGKSGEQAGKCAVCGKKHGAIYNFAGTLKWYKIKGTHATVVCIRELGFEASKGRRGVFPHAVRNSTDRVPAVEKETPAAPDAGLEESQPSNMERCEEVRDWSEGSAEGV